MIERSWKRFYGNSERELRGGILLQSFVLGKQPITVLIVGPSKDSGQNFF
jgi:hypothetical protein